MHGVTGIGHTVLLMIAYVTTGISGHGVTGVGQAVLVMITCVTTGISRHGVTGVGQAVLVMLTCVTRGISRHGETWVEHDRGWTCSSGDNYLCNDGNLLPLSGVTGVGHAVMVVITCVTTGVSRLCMR